MAIVLTKAEMVFIAEDYFGYHTDNMCPTQIRDLISLTPLAEMPPGSWKHGEALKHGLFALLVNPNRQPLHDEPASRRFRLSLFQFDMTPCEHNRLYLWKDQKDLVIRYFYMVCCLEPNEIIRDHRHIGGNHSGLANKYKYLKNSLAAILIHRLAYGWQIRVKNLTWLCCEGKLQRRKWVHNHMVRIMVNYLLKEMNPKFELSYEEIMVANVRKVTEHIVRIAKTKGVWRESIVLPRATLPADHPNCYDEEDQDVCKGIPYEFARLCALVIPGFEHASEDHMNHMTVEEERRLYSAHDNTYCFPRYPPSWKRHMEYGNFAHMRLR